MARPPAARARQFLLNPPSSDQSRALIKSTLNCLSDSSNSGLEQLLLEWRERLAESNAPPQGASVKERELPRLYCSPSKKSSVTTQKMQASLEDQMSSSMPITWHLVAPVQR